ncbi:hypothetical protein Tcan_01579, partial [Toxocara canis]
CWLIWSGICNKHDANVEDEPCAFHGVPGRSRVEEITEDRLRFIEQISASQRQVGAISYSQIRVALPATLRIISTPLHIPDELESRHWRCHCQHSPHSSLLEEQEPTRFLLRTKLPFYLLHCLLLQFRKAPSRG